MYKKLLGYYKVSNSKAGPRSGSVPKQNLGAVEGKKKPWRLKRSYGGFHWSLEEACNGASGCRFTSL
jgi:hypothetical protein